ncbi:MAG TPA: hypothetical protein VLM85_15335 [Polyangiaceae bacterium]|nr:hypothetical protein [Polyangiaceae bacterium]
MMTVTAWLVFALLLLLVTWQITTRSRRRPKKSGPSTPEGT